MLDQYTCKACEMMYKRSELMKIVAVSIVFLFLVSGYLVMAHGSGSEKSISSGDKSGNISIKNLPIAPVDNSSNDTVIANISVGSNPGGIAYDSSNGCVYVTNFNSNSVSVINGATNTVIANISVGSNPLGIAYDSSNGYLYVTNFNSSSVSVINGATNTIITSFAVGLNAGGIAYDSSNGYVYVTNFISNGVISNRVSVINGATNTVIANISVGSDPAGVAYDSSNGYIYVANEFSNNVSVINGATNTVIANIAVGARPLQLAYDSSNGYVYVTQTNGVLVVINGATNKVIGRIAVGSNQWGVAYDPSNGYVYVANSNSSTVSVISTSPKVIKIYKLTFTESGLPSGASWSVTLTGRIFNGQYINVTLSSTTNTITFNEPNGTYSYIIHLPSGYQTNNVKGHVYVSGNSETLTFGAQQAIIYLWIGIIAVVIIIAIPIAAILFRRGKNKQSVKEWKEPPKQN